MNPAELNEMIDRVFADRYRLDELIGVGSVSAVFAAFDAVEDRWVALKVFAPELGRDDRFVERLMHAAQEAANLTHPNVAAIYDWGVDGEPYIVSELCEGGSLRAMLDAGYLLSASQALVVALEASRALHYGHELGLVHRNLRPENLLFTTDQRLRITDYGLGRALTDAPVSVASRALESVRYASPEQARGRPVDTASDLYSLALVINEIVSGRPPDVAETVVGTLMARAEAAATPDVALAALVGPIERCGRVDPADRPEADELTIALLAAAETMARPGSLPLVGIEQRFAADVASNDAWALESTRLTFGVVAGPDSTEWLGEPDPDESVSSFDASPRGADDFGGDDGDATTGALLGTPPWSDHPDEDGFGDDIDLDDIDLDDGDLVAEDSVPLDVPRLVAVVADRPQLGGFGNLSVAEPVFASVPSSSSTAPRLDVPERSVPSRDVGGRYEELEDDADERLPWWPLLVLVLLAAGVIAGAIFLTAERSAIASPEVPDLVGMSYDEIDATIAGHDWRVNRLETRRNDSAVGEIVAQSPEPGTPLDKGDTLTVTVSLGSEMVEIPSDIAGLTVEQAASRLGSVGLALGDLSEENNENLDAGLVIGLAEPTTQKPAGEGVALRVSLGPTARVVPDDVIGMNIAEATEVLTGLRLQAVEEPVFDPSAAIGTVLGSEPAPGEAVEADSQVTLLVSVGPEPVEMPDVEGLALDEAIDAIEALGLVFIDSEGTPGELAIGTDPPAGEVVDVGTEVVIILDEPSEEDEG